jgi:hypothetical protein
MAWTDLEPILHREGIARDEPHLFDCLHTVSAAQDTAERSRALDAAATALGTNGNASGLLRALANDQHAAPRRVALELAARLLGAHPQFPAPDPNLIALLRPLLRDRWVPTTVRLAAAAALSRAVKPNESAKVIQDFVAGFGNLRFLKQRKKLRQRFAGRKSVFDRCAARLAARVQFRCPRCGVKLARAAMAQHLWDRHHRLMVGRRVRSPWRLIDRWAVGPGGGPINAHRQLLRLVRQDDDAHAALRRDAYRRLAGLCPHCFATIPLDPAMYPSATDITPLNLSHGRLSGHGFVVELTDSLTGPRLHIESPTGVLFHGPEPNLPSAVRLRRLAVIPPLIVAFVFAATTTPMWAFPATLLTLLAALWLAVVLRTGEPDDRVDRVVDHAWLQLAPHLRVGGAFSASTDFLAGLAAISHRYGDATIRERALRRSIATIHAAIEKGAALPILLIALRRLQVADAGATGGDPVGILADAVRPCFTGALTPAAADLLLADDVLCGWTRSQRARLRVLLTARAFAAGLGVWDLHALGRAVPRLGHALNVEDTDGLARLRLLWDLRPTRPWRHCGPAATVFELAAYPMLGGQHLETAPDLLLFQPLPAGGEPIHLLACGRGLIVGGGLIHSWPTAFESRPLPGSKGGGYELRFGPHSVQVHGNVDDLIRKLETWGRYFFEEFLPWIGNALSRSDDASPDRLGRLTATCPECATPFLGRRGALGRSIFAKSSGPVASP